MLTKPARVTETRIRSICYSAATNKQGERLAESNPLADESFPDVEAL